MEAMWLTKTPWPILSDDQCSLVEDALKPAIKDQDCPWASAGAPIGTSSVSELPSRPSLKIDLQLQEAVSFGFSLVLLHQTYYIDCASKYK